MRQLLVFFVFCFSISFANAQYYALPTWVEDISYSSGGNAIYAIGISDPRMEDDNLAETIAIRRAITMAILFNEVEIHYASDFFEKKSEEYRWFVMKEDLQELGKVESSAYINNSSYELIESDINKNGETMVLIKYMPNNSLAPNFFIVGEYYRQDFEISNTRSHESLRSIKLSTNWIEDENKDSLNTFFYMSNFNGKINTQIQHDTISITSPGYYYHYAHTLPNIFELRNYNTSVSLLKGLWVAYLDSYMQSIMKISKNHSSKMKTVGDNYQVNRNDGITETNQESLARIVCINTLSFEYGGMAIHKNFLFPRIYLANEREAYVSLAIEQIKNNKITEEGKPKKSWFGRLFSRKNRN